MTARFHGDIIGSNKAAAVRGSTRSGLVATLRTPHGDLKVIVRNHDGVDHYRVVMLTKEEPFDPKVLAVGIFPEKGED